MDDFEYEKDFLGKMLEIIRKELKNNLDVYDELLGDYRREPEKYANLIKIMHDTIKNYKYALDKPYFARIDFALENSDKSDLYIGKHGLITNDGKQIVIDWRSPVSSLYYDGNLGSVSFIAPEGEIKGVLSLKRQFDIEHGVLKAIHDVDIVSNDKLLQSYLERNNNSRIKNIVSTIQKEQNDIIRKSMFNNIILQGVAGSGKTTVALHRIAYLVYTYSKDVKEGNFLILGPNEVFLKYIEGVLPDLDVNGINQMTVSSYFLNYIAENISLIDQNVKRKEYFKGSSTYIESFKSSLEYKNLLDSYINNYIKNIIKDDLTIDDFLVMSKKDMQEIFDSVYDYNKSLDSIVSIVSSIISKRISENLDDHLIRFSDYTYKLFKKVNSKEELEDLKKKLIKNRNEIEKGCKKLLKKYFKNSSSNVLKVYSNFINDSTLEVSLKKETLSNIKKKKVDYVDLAALAYIKYRLFNDGSKSKYKHIVIDEAQDLSLFDYSVITNINKNSTYSVFGDMMQSIYSYRSISSWDDLNYGVFNGKADILNLLQSYRSTEEIMSVANSIVSYLGLDKSKESIRHGDSVSFSCVSKKDFPLFVKDKLNEYMSKGYKTVAIISKTYDEAKKVTVKLENIGVNVKFVENGDDIIIHNICSLSSDLAKGLEFDAVILNNVSNDVYSINNDIDMKLLYVSITRALHELSITYDDNLSLVLEDSMKLVKKIK